MDDKWDTEINLIHQPFFPVPFAPGRIDASLCTVADITTYLPFEADKETAKTWARNHSSQVVADRILPRLNEFVQQVKSAYPKAILTGTMRSVGPVDVMYSYLYFEGDSIEWRMTPAMSAWMPPPRLETISPDSAALSAISQDGTVPYRKLSKEWVAITRAVDLANHGYYEEALLVSFALLDALVQDFLKEHLDKRGAGSLIEKIESDRLRTFLGPLTRICLGESPLDDDRSTDDLAWLNGKRNAIVHRGERCSRAESQRGITAVWQLLKYLSERGAGYSLPADLEFWTPTSDGAR